MLNTTILRNIIFRDTHYNIHIILINPFYCESLEYVPENPLEVAKYGQNQAVINALVHKVTRINGKMSIY